MKPTQRASVNVDYDLFTHLEHQAMLRGQSVRSYIRLVLGASLAKTADLDLLIESVAAAIADSPDEVTPQLRKRAKAAIALADPANFPDKG
jgi:hypothetical protein